MPLTLWLWICLLLGRIFPWETRRVQVELLGSVYLLCWLRGFQVRAPFPSRLFCVLIASFPFWPKISSSSTQECSVLQGEYLACFHCCLVGTLFCLAAALFDLWYRLLISKFFMNFFFPLLQMQRNKMAFCTTQMLFLASYWFLDLTQNFHLFWSCCRFAWVLGLTAVLILSCGASAYQKCGISPLVSMAFLIPSLHTTSLYHLFFLGLRQNTSYANVHLENSFLLSYF